MPLNAADPQLIGYYATVPAVCGPVAMNLYGRHAAVLLNFSGLSPAVVGAIKSKTGSLTPVMFILGALFVVAGIAVVAGMRRPLSSATELAS